VIDFEPSDEEVGRRIDVVLAARAGITRTLAQRAVRSGAVTVGGKNVRPSHRVEKGDVVAGALPLPEVAPPGPEDIAITVRYSDERVLVVSKPAGMVTHPARGHATGTLVNALLALGGPLAGAGSTRPGIVHRLDKDTSGLLLVAKDDDAQVYLVDELRARRIERRYAALVRGTMPARSGTIEAPVGRHPIRRRKMAVTSAGRPSVTHYEVLGEGAGVSLLDVALETGRTHQIRVHLAHLGHPVLGDRAYGGGSEPATTLGLARPFLHAWKLTFPHPDDGRPVAITDPLSPDLAAALQAAGIQTPASFA